MPHSEEERRAMLTGLGLNPDAPALSKPVKKSKPPKAQSSDEITLAPPGVDPHSMPVADIVFDPRLLDKYTDLAFNAEGADASRDIFKLYKSPHKNTERHSMLNARIGKFIRDEHLKRKTGGAVKEHIASTKEQRDIAAVLAANGYTAADVAAMLTKQA